MGKGSKRRPAQVDEATVARNWERVFGSTDPRPESSWGFVYDPGAAFASNWDQTFASSTREPER